MMGCMGDRLVSWVDYRYSIKRSRLEGFEQGRIAVRDGS